MSEFGVAPHFLAPLHSLLPFRRQGRKASIGRIDDQRRALRFDNPVAAVVPELVIRNDAARGIIQTAYLRVDEIAVLAPILFPFPGRRFLIATEESLRAQGA